jgi:hypothetical protein
MTVPTPRWAAKLELTAEEDAKVAELAAAVAAKATVRARRHPPPPPRRRPRNSPRLTHPPTPPQASPELAAFCTRGTYVRYLRARSWAVARAARMLELTLDWRRDFRPDALSYSAQAAEAERGKVYVLERPCRAGRPVVFMRPARDEFARGEDDTERLRWVVYVLEQGSRLADADAPDGKMTWLIDFVGYSRRNAAPMGTSMRTLSILQNHYPERLGRAVNFAPPFLFEVFFRAISPFIDPVTREKLVFEHPPKAAPEKAAEVEAADKADKAAAEEQLTGMARHFELEHLDAPLGGALPVDGMLDPAAYPRRMAALEAERTAAVAAATAALAAAGGAGAGGPAE